MSCGVDALRAAGIARQQALTYNSSIPSPRSPGQSGEMRVGLLCAIVVLFRERNFFVVKSFLAKCFRQFVAECLDEFPHHYFEAFTVSGFQVNRRRRVGLLEIKNVDPIAGCGAGRHALSDPPAQRL